MLYWIKQNSLNKKVVYILDKNLSSFTSAQDHKYFPSLLQTFSDAVHTTSKEWMHPPSTGLLVVTSKLCILLTSHAVGGNLHFKFYTT